MSTQQEAQRFLAERRTEYIRAFNTPAGQAVLEDLARFCRAHQSTFHADPRIHAVAEGRREVWLRIQQHLQLTDDDLWRFYGSPRVAPQPTTPKE